MHARRVGRTGSADDSAERIVHAQYDGTFENLTQVLAEYENRLRTVVIIDIRAEQGANCEKWTSHVN